MAVFSEITMVDPNSKGKKIFSEFLVAQKMFLEEIFKLHNKHHIIILYMQLLQSTK